MKKINRNSQEYFDTLINFELEKYGTTVKELKETHPDGMIDGEPWYHHYSFETLEEYETWRKRCKEFTTKQCTPKMTSRFFDLAWPMFNLSYGLRYNFLLNDPK